MRWAAGVLLLSPLAASAFEAVDALTPSSSGRFLAYPSEPLTPYELWAQAGIQYDTNALRRTTGDNNETLARLGVGGRWDQRVIGRQALHLIGQIDGFLYNKFSDLDNIGYFALGEWRYEVGNDLAGAIGLSRRKFQAALSQVQRATHDPITQQTYHANGRYLIGPHLGVRAGVEFTDYHRPTRVDSDTETIVGTAGVEYVSSLGNTLGLEVRQGQGDAPVTRLVDPQSLFTGNEFTQRDVAVVGSWVATPQIRLAGNIGRTTRTYTLLPGHDFSGSTWRLGAHWAVTPRTNFEFEHTKHVSSIIDVGAAHVVVKGYAFGPAWAVTAKTNLSARFLRQHLVYGGDPEEILGLEPQREEIVRSFRLGAYWEYTRKVHVTAAFENGNRESNILGRNYRFNAYTANVKYFF